MAISQKIESAMTRASFIRKMFEEANRLRAEVGPDRVFDFTLGNPILEPPEAFCEALRRAVLDPTPGMHRYMPNAGFPQSRAKVAAYMARQTGMAITPEDVIMSCGAGPGLNVALKALLDPGDEVVVVAPFFPEYAFYVDNHGGTLKVAQSSSDFDLDFSSLDATIGEKTKALILNSPNNPTGRMYSEERLAELGRLLQSKEKRHGRPITILSDEPYRKIVFDDRRPPDIFKAHPNAIFIYSHSKDLGLAGERVGYLVISPFHQDRRMIQEATTFTTRTLGFVNAPALFQRTVVEVQDQSVDIANYQRLRDLFCQSLQEAGLDLIRPEGAFYLFPKTPIADDLAFVQLLQNNYVLAVPGSGFGRKGYIRLCFCVTERQIAGAAPIFKKVVRECLERSSR